MKLKSLILIFLTLLNLLTLQLLSKSMSVFAQDTPATNDNQVDCYDIQVLPETKPTKEELQDRLDTLEKQFKEKKISEKSYNLVKEYILKEIKEAQ